MPSTPTTLVVLAVVHHEGRYLIVEERDGTFYLPAGKVERGEDLLSAAARETLEEAGVAIELLGLLGFDHDEGGGHARLRFAFAGAVERGRKTGPETAAPGAAAPGAKTRADEHSRGARWVTKGELGRLPLRHPEVLAWIERDEARRRGAAMLPCSAYAWYPAVSAR